MLGKHTDVNITSSLAKGSWHDFGISALFTQHLSKFLMLFIVPQLNSQLWFSISRLDDWWECPSNIQRAGQWIHQDGQRPTSLSGDQSKTSCVYPYYTAFLLWTDDFCLSVNNQICLASVHQEDCSQQDTALDELAHRSADLDDLDIDMIDQGVQEDAGVVDDITPALHYLSPCRSLSRLSKVDTHRVRVATQPVLCLERTFLSSIKTLFSLFLYRWFFLHQMWQATCLWPQVLTTHYR